MRALRYFVTEAAASLWRGRRAAAMAILTIGAGLFVLGFFLILNANLRGLTARWSEAAEFAVYLRDEVTPEQRAGIERAIDDSGLVARQQFVSKEQAAARFREEFPDLGATSARLERNPFPASIDIRLRPGAAATGPAVDDFARTLSSQAGVADVRYDRQWLSRLNAVVRLVRMIGVVIVTLLAIAAALTVASVVRLAADARRDEIEIMQLVGAPFTYIRGPLVVEGVIQGGAGALIAILALAVLSGVLRARYGAVAANVLGMSSITFLPAELSIVLVLGGMLLGCVGGLIVARAVR